VVKRQHSLATGAVIASLALLAACGGSSGSGSGTSGSSGGGSTIAYGVLSCFTGRLASLGQAMLQGSQIAQDAVNQAGGILGKKLTLVHADTSCDEADAVPATQDLLSKGVVGIIGPETQEINAVEPILRSAHIVDEFQGGDTARDHQSDPYFFRDSPSDSQLGVAMALYAHMKGYTRAALLFYAEAGAQTFSAPITAAFEKLGGQIVANVSVPPDQTDYLPQVRQIIAAHPQVIFIQTDAPTGAVVFRDFKQTDNLAIPFIGTDVTGGSDFLKALTYPIAHEALTSVYGTSVTGTANNVFMSYFNKRFPGQQPLANANYAYDAVISLALADDYAGTTDGTKVAADMTKVTNPPGTACYSYSQCLSLIKQHQKVNYEGASGDLNYNQYNNVFGPYGAFKVNLQGTEEQVALMTAPQLAAATP
jgi:ABC-type branched-subunit amino acid transport system substrate-binding protein